MKIKTSLFLLMLLAGKTNSVMADISFSGIPEYQVESAKKDEIFNENYTNYENKNDKKGKRNRIEEFYSYFHNTAPFNLNISNWKKLSDSEKISALLKFLTEMSEENRKKLNETQFITDETKKDFYINKYQDEFSEKVNGLDGKTEETFVTDYTGKKIPLTRTVYEDENGKKYVKEVYHYEGNDLIELKENNQPLYDYKDVKKIKGKYVVFSSGFSTDGKQQSKSSSSVGHQLPNGYTVARDRSEHLSDSEKGKLVVIPTNPDLLPEGVEIIDDGQGGKIIKAPESAYKSNGNLRLKPDATLQRTIMIGNSKGIESNYRYEDVRISEEMTKKKKKSIYGRDAFLSADNMLYKNYSTIDGNGNIKTYEEE